MSTSDKVMRSLINLRERRREFYNWRNLCAEYRKQGKAPAQYRQELKDLNDAKALFYGAVQLALEAAEEEIEQAKKRGTCSHPVSGSIDVCFDCGKPLLTEEDDERS